MRTLITVRSEIDYENETETRGLSFVFFSCFGRVWLRKQLKGTAWLSAVSSQSGRGTRGARVVQVGAGWAGTAWLSAARGRVGL